MEKPAADDIDVRQAWEIHVYAENLLAHRMNWTMVAQAMLLVAFVTVFVAKGNAAGSAPVALLTLLEVALIFAGLMISVFQYTRIRELSLRIVHLQETILIPRDPAFALYMNAKGTGSHPRRLRQHQAAFFLGGTWVVCLLVSVLSVALHVGGQ